MLQRISEFSQLRSLPQSWHFESIMRFKVAVECGQLSTHVKLANLEPNELNDQ